MKPKYKLTDGTVLTEAVIAKGDSYSSISNQVYAAINSMIRKGADMDLDGDGDADCNDYAYIQDLYPDLAIYSMNGCLFSIKYTINKDEVKLGAPVRVEVCYAPVKEAARIAVGSSFNLKEAKYDKSTGKLTVTVIKPGFNTSKSRYYKESALKRHYKVFEGAKMFVNHQTSAEEKARPEGDVNLWVANLTRTWVESDGTIMGDAQVIDPAFKAKLDTLAEAKLLNEMGISIRAIGEAYVDTVEGQETNVVESFIAARSVDFVTFPGAGGRVEAIESDRSDPNDVDLVNLVELRKRRPDLVQLIESNLKQEIQQMKTAEQLQTELNEANGKVGTLTTQLKEANEKITNIESKQKKADAAAELDKLLKESGLPDKAQQKLLTRFKEATEVAGMKEAVDEEKAYVADLTGNRSTGTTRTGVQNMGESHQEGAGRETKTGLETSFAKLGLTEAEAKIAAAGRR